MEGQGIQNQKSFIWADNIRFIATISVVVLHVASPVLYQYNKTSNSNWLAANAIDSFVRYSVPLFVMLTGALLLGRTYDYVEFIKRRLSKIFYPFLFWTIVYLFVAFYSDIINKSSVKTEEFIYWFIDKITGGASFHLWYLYMIIGLYLFIPFVSKFINACNESEILIFLGIWIFTLFLNLPILESLTFKFDLTYFSGYLGYLILGYYLVNYKFDLGKKVFLLFMVLFSGVFLTFLGTSIMSEEKGAMASEFYEYLTPNVFLSSSSVFLLLLNADVSNRFLKGIRDKVCNYSYGIYLIHVLVLLLLNKLGLNWKMFTPWLSIPLISVTCIVISILILSGINRFKFGKIIIG